MLLESGNDFCAPCEPIAGVWHERNDPIGRHPIAIVDVVDVYLPAIQSVNLLDKYLAVPLTVSTA